MVVKKHKVKGEAGHTVWENARTRQGLCVKCPDPLSPHSGRFCEAHRVWHNEKTKKHYHANKAAANYRSKISGHRARVRLMVQLGGLVCAWCGEQDYRVLSIDHVNGHERAIAERRRTRSGLTTDDVYRMLRGEEDLANLRVLCANCQARNEHVRGNRTVYPEIVTAVLEAGGALPPLAGALPAAGWTDFDATARRALDARGRGAVS